MTTARVDQVNAGLMLASCLLAFALPFELFLFSYAVLGPLHYATQIGWLHQRDYFVPGARAGWIFLCLAVLASIAAYSGAILGWIVGHHPDGSLAVSADVERLVTASRPILATITFLALGGALLLAAVRGIVGRAFAAAALVAVAFAVHGAMLSVLVFALLLPTLIHVFVFTGLFIVYGALRHRSLWGVLSLVVFLCCSASFWLIQPAPSGYAVGAALRGTYDAAFFELNLNILANIQPEAVTHDTTWSDLQRLIYASAPGHALMRFIAFAYTYHYLNWFSKTSVIRWHKVPRSWHAATAVIWVGALALYAVDYRVGMGALFFLSILHVYLELPLDWMTVGNIGREIRGLVGRGARGRHVVNGGSA